MSICSKNAWFGSVGRNVPCPWPRLCSRLLLTKKIKIYFNESFSFQGFPPPQGSYTCRSYLWNGFQMAKEVNFPPKWEGDWILVPVSKITVNFSTAGFLLLGKQDMIEMLSPENFNSEAYLNSCCQEWVLLAPIAAPKWFLPIPCTVFAPWKAMPCSTDDAGTLHVFQHFNPSQCLIGVWGSFGIVFYFLYRNLNC